MLPLLIIMTGCVVWTTVQQIQALDARDLIRTVDGHQVLDLNLLSAWSRRTGFDRAKNTLNARVHRNFHQSLNLQTVIDHLAAKKPLPYQWWKRQPDEEKANGPVLQHLFENDILLTKYQLDTVLSSGMGSGSRRMARKVIRDVSKRWQLPIRYKIAPDTFPIETRTKINAALRYWQENTCVTFQEDRNVNDGNFLKFHKGIGCFTNIGVIGGQQDLSLGEGCEHFGIIVHEIGHALGFWHEHMRFDRNDYVLVNIDNIKENELFNFWKWAEWRMDVFADYDYGSIMHYKATAFTLDPSKPTLLTTDRRYQETIGQRLTPSFIDVLQMNMAYRCIGAKCGGVLLAKQRWQSLRYSYQPSTTEAWCYWQISSDSSAKIEIRLGADFKASCSEACFEEFLEIKASQNPQITGFRTCCSPSTELISANSTLVPIIAYASKMLSFSLEFRARSLSPECPPTGGVWGPWLPWTECTQKQSIKERRRLCLSTKPDCPCKGRNMVFMRC